MNDSRQLVVFSLDGQRFALGLGSVERVLLALEVTPLPGAPEVVLGVFDLQGRIVPVIDLRRRFGFPTRPVVPADHLVVARTPRRRVALLVDECLDVAARGGADVVPAGAVVPGLEHVQGITSLADGIVLIHDLDRCLSLDEEKALDAALEARPGETR